MPVVLALQGQWRKGPKAAAQFGGPSQEVLNSHPACRCLGPLQDQARCVSSWVPTAVAAFEKLAEILQGVSNAEPTTEPSSPDSHGRALAAFPLFGL